MQCGSGRTGKGCHFFAILKNMNFRVVIRCILSGLLMLPAMSSSLAADSLSAGGSELKLQWRGGFNPQERQKLKTWLQHAASSAAALYGRLPRNPIRIVLQRSGHANEPVPFGHILRKPPQGIRFLVNPDFPLTRFTDDWTAVHEFVHLYIPYPGQRDVWLSEGLATYYQNLLQARTGVISEHRAWQKLYEGFVRGQKDNRYNHLSLAELTPRMRETRSFMRVYWAGTAYFLQADLMLRKRSGNRQSLDTVIREFVNCCLERDAETSGRSLVETFDRLSGVNLFSRLYGEYREYHSQPDPLPLLEQLGISIRNKEVVLDQKDSAGVQMRRAMTRPLNTQPDDVS